MKKKYFIIKFNNKIRKNLFNSLKQINIYFRKKKKIKIF